jgi:hypothetical protein
MRVYNVTGMVVVCALEANGKRMEKDSDAKMDIRMDGY